MDLTNYNPRDEVCEHKGDWGFIGYLENGTAVSIGVFSSYRDGAAHANSWLQSTKRAARWEAEKLYDPVLGED